MMLGSSKSLVRALEAVFANKGLPKSVDTDLTTTIEEYLAKHNNYTAIKQSSYNIHEELYRLYNGHIKSSHKLDLENKFLTVLTKVCDVFGENELHLWILTYLKSAIDSAGYDLAFVENSRTFIDKVLVSYSETKCEILTNLHARASSSLAQQLLDIYMREDTLIATMKLNVTDEQRESQAYHERIRFIRSNCTKLLLEYGLKHTDSYCHLLNKYIQHVKFRHEAIVLLGYLVGADVKSGARIVDSDLFKSLLKCLLYDLDPAIVHCALNDLFILIPKSADNLGNYLSDILLVYVRILTWNQITVPRNINTFASESSLDLRSWKIALPYAMESGNDVRFNFQYLCTFIYGLFYFNFGAFIRDPLDYLAKHVPSDFSSERLKQWSLEVPDKTSPILRAATITKQILGGFLVHPKYCMENDEVKELKSSTSWLPDTASLEEIAVACLSLNPGIFIKENEATTPVQSSYAASIGGGTLSQSSSLAGPMYFQANGPTKQIMKSSALQDRKVSIVPTHLVLDNNETQGTEEVKFKEFGFTNRDLLQVFDTSGITCPSSPKQDQRDLVSDLLYDHERLFTTVKHDKLYHHNNFTGRTGSIDPITSVADHTNEKLKQETRLGRPMSLSATNLEPPSVFEYGNTLSKSVAAAGAKDDASTLHNPSNDPSQTSLNKLNGDGSIIDFYQRELLLFKNELEFSSYLKHLNKFHYLKMKEGRNQGEDTLYDDLISRDEADEFTKVMNAIKQERSEKQCEFDCQFDLLTTKIEQLESVKRELNEKLLELQQSTKTNHKEYDELVKIVIPNKDYEIEQLKLKLKLTELAGQELKENQSQQPIIPDLTEDTTIQKSLEDQIYNIKVENQILTQQLAQLTQENKDLQLRYNSTMSQYETKLAKTKLSLSETLTSLTSPYDKKITELQAVIHKYQALLEERTRNQMASTSSSLSLSTTSGSVPIPIIQRQNSSSSSGNYSFGQDSNHNMNTIPSRSVAPIQHMVRNGSKNSAKSSKGLGSISDGDALPLMKGRGGLQKKTRKFM